MYAAGRELPRGSTDPTLMNQLLGESRVARFLRRRGYRYVLLPSSWWSSTQASPLADSVVQVFAGFELDRELGRSEFRRALRRKTILDYVHRDEPGTPSSCAGRSTAWAGCPRSRRRCSPSRTC